MLLAHVVVQVGVLWRCLWDPSGILLLRAESSHVLCRAGPGWGVAGLQ